MTSTPATRASRHPSPGKLRVPDTAHWPAAVRSAELRRGSLVPCGPGVRPVGWPDTPRVRLAALRPWLPTGTIAVFMTAAWVWDACPAPGRPLHVSMAGRRARPRTPPLGVRVHQFRAPATDTVAFGSGATTTRRRTLCDLLRLSEDFAREHRLACRVLRLQTAWGDAEIADALARGPAPHRQRAFERLREL